MGVSLELLAFDPSVVAPFRAARAGDLAPLRAWLQAYVFAPDPELVEMSARRVAVLEAHGAPALMIDHARQALHQARHGPLAGKNVAEANADWLLAWATQAVHRSLDLGKTWDVLHYGLDPGRRARDVAVHWRFLDDPPTPYDLALYGHHRTALLSPARAASLGEPTPEEAADDAEFWEELFLPYDEYENDAGQVCSIAAALDACSAEALAKALADELPEHVYMGTLEDAREHAERQRVALSAFYRAAAASGHHVRTSWLT